MRSDTDGTAGHETEDADTPACVDLVPLTPTDRRARIARQMTRPDPTFVAHLIATAAHLPQTRNLRRAAPSDAHSAYTAQDRPQPTVGCRTRQII
ncbi:hypothetical protein [Bradyrhizobium sp.]|uniref:hypothetical protein n=1 Tax=Bradyrhizobium sp. TaxID=376 RepID=UPI001ED078B1|nr:hypothetical protein [Bradyrhizobium sp.]MBV9983613.1 hypothetical protein [Bradyrhizobium sp.]